MIKLSLRPYHGNIYLCKTRKELHKQYKKLTKEDYPYTDAKTGGRYVMLEGKTLNDKIWLVWASEKSYLAHEYSHILLKTFNRIGHDPCTGDGEPFCYMLSQLLLES